MDEPLSNLDAKLRVHMRTELAELHQRLGATFIYVTHDQVEAMTMSDRVAMMDSGDDHAARNAQPSSTSRPANVKVAQFIGSPAINLLPGTVGAGGRRRAASAASWRSTVALPAGAPLTIGIRPEAIAARPATAAQDGEAWLLARLRRRENLGAEYILHFDLPGADLDACHRPRTGTAALAGGRPGCARPSTPWPATSSMRRALASRHGARTQAKPERASRSSCLSGPDP